MDRSESPGRARTMFQVRFNGRSGQGVVTAAELLAEAAFRESRHAQASRPAPSGQHADLRASGLPGLRRGARRIMPPEDPASIVVTMRH